MVLEEDHATLVTQCLDDVLTLFSAKDDSSKGLIHGLCVVEEARILVDDVDGPAKSRPGFSGGRVHVARSVNVGASTVDSAVDDEAGCVDGDLVSTDDLSVFVDLDHITGLEHTEMLAHASTC